MNEFINNALAKNIIAIVQPNSKPTHIVSDTIPMNVIDQNYTPEITYL